MPSAVLDSRAVIRVAGPDAKPFLQGLLTNDVLALAPGGQQWTALLSPQGKVLFDMILHEAGESGVLIDCEATRAGELARRLAMYKLKRPVEIAPAALGVVVRWGEDALGGPPDPRLPALGARVLTETPEANGPEIAWQAHRMALGVSEGAAELGVDKTLWLEANAVELHGVSFTKGCYVGQENTARMHHRDKVRRRLLPVTLTADPGDAREIMAGERAAGELRAWVGERGIAWLRMEYADMPLTLRGAPLRVEWPYWLER